MDAENKDFTMSFRRDQYRQETPGELATVDEERGLARVDSTVELSTSKASELLGYLDKRETDDKAGRRAALTTRRISAERDTSSPSTNNRRVEEKIAGLSLLIFASLLAVSMGFYALLLVVLYSRFDLGPMQMASVTFISSSVLFLVGLVVRKALSSSGDFLQSSIKAGRVQEDSRQEILDLGSSDKSVDR